MKCLKCHYENPIGKSYCLECGTKLEEMKCKECDSILTEKIKFCGDCGTKNPFYKEKIEIQTSTDVSSEETRKSPFSFEKKQLRLIVFITVITLMFSSFILTFGAISSTRTNAITGAAYNFTFTQNSLQKYSGYFQALTMERDQIISDHYTEYYDYLLGIDGNVSERHHSHIFSSLNTYGASIVSRNNNPTFLNTLNYFVEVVLLLIVQVIPLIIIGFITYYFVNNKSMDRVNKHFLTGGIFGILLMIFTNNIFTITRPGYGLIGYTMIMFFAYFSSFFITKHMKKELYLKETIFYCINVVLSFIFIAVIANSFLSVGYEYREDTYGYRNIRTSDLTSFITVLSEDNDFYDTISSSNLLESSMRVQSDTTRNHRYVINTFDFSTLMRIELENEWQSYKEATFILSMLSISMIYLSLLNLVFVAKNGQIEVQFKLFLIHLFMVLNVIWIIAYAVVYRNSLTKVFYDLQLPLHIRLSFGLFVALILLIILTILNLSRSKASVNDK